MLRTRRSYSISSIWHPSSGMLRRFCGRKGPTSLPSVPAAAISWNKLLQQDMVCNPSSQIKRIHKYRNKTCPFRSMIGYAGVKEENDLPALWWPLKLPGQPGKYFWAVPFQASSKRPSSSKSHRRKYFGLSIRSLKGHIDYVDQCWVPSLRLCRVCIVSTLPSELSFLAREWPWKSASQM